MSISLPRLDGVKILSLEDDLFDAQLADDALRKDFPNLRITRVETRSAFLSALATPDFDLILSDYTIPAFSGLEALDLARQHCPRTPFVFFSGTIGEERAVEALKNGATDYVLKDRPGRLSTAIRKALGEVRLENAVLRKDDFCALAFGVAHRINNSLTGMYLGVPLLREKVSDQEAHDTLDVIETCTRDCAEFVRHLELMARETGQLRTDHLKSMFEPSTRPMSEGTEPNSSHVNNSQGLVGTKDPHELGPVVLVVDDDDAVRILIKALLEIGGYRVVVAENGAEGLNTYKRMQKFINAVVTDIYMPVMDGCQLVSELRTFDPAIGVVVMSGYDPTAGLAEEPGKLIFVSKPMTKFKLLTAVGEVLVGKK